MNATLMRSVTLKLVGNDVISHMPDPIIGHILGCMPLADAVRTSVLSHEWRYKWLNISKIEYRGGEIAKEKLLSDILGMLQAHKGAIHEFIIVYPEFDSCTKFDQILKLVCKKGVKRMIFGITIGNPHFLDSSFFSCAQLEHLNIWGCVFEPPPEFRGFSQLVSLLFFNVTTTAEVFSTFIPQCPLLECLFLTYSTGFPTFNLLEVTAPNLKFFRCQAQFKTLITVASPCLVDVSITLFLPNTVMELEEESTVLQLNSVDSIVSLHLDDYYMMSLHRSGSRSKFENLRVLRLSGICFGIRHVVKCMLELMKSCGSLEKLIIETFPDTAEQFDDVKFNELLDLSCSHIHEVQMLDVSGSKSELAFIKTLLLQLLQLETMIIAIDSDNVDDGGSNILKQVSQFQRTSPLAIVKFKDYDVCQSSLLRLEEQIIDRYR